VVHRETDLGEKVEDTLVVRVGAKTTDVGEGGGVRHVNGNGVSVTERSLGNELVER